MIPAATLREQLLHTTPPAHTDVLAEDTVQPWQPDVTSALPNMMRFWQSCLTLTTHEAVLDACLRFMDVDPVRWSGHELLHAVNTDLRREDGCEEVSGVTGRLFERLVDDHITTLPATQCLDQIAKRYLESTAYLQPLLHDYACAALALSSESKLSKIALFLRDAIWYWPSLQALRPTATALDLVVFTRPLRKAGSAPLMFQQRQSGTFEWNPGSHLRGSLLLDAGLYGTLVADLARHHHTDEQTMVLFLGSQNPNLLGFLNQRAHYLHADTACEQDVVRYVDSVECLLKPFHLKNTCDGRVEVHLASPIAFVCATAFMWRQFRYSSKKSGDVRSETMSLLPVPDTTSWLLPRAVPIWDQASDFVRGWEVNNIASIEATTARFDRWASPEVSRSWRDEMRREDGLQAG